MGDNSNADELFEGRNIQDVVKSTLDSGTLINLPADAEEHWMRNEFWNGERWCRIVTFHDCKSEDSALVVSIGTEQATPAELNQLCVALNNDPIRTSLLEIEWVKSEEDGSIPVTSHEMMVKAKLALWPDLVRSVLSLVGLSKCAGYLETNQEAMALWQKIEAIDPQ